MASREEKKRLTRQALMDAALTLVGQGENFAHISLREVAKLAGVVPTAFYRHFRDMEELGFNLVDELGMTLRRLIRSARQADVPVSSMAGNSVALYMQYVIEHRNLFLFMAQSRTGGTAALRHAVRNELAYFARELAIDLRDNPVFAHLSADELDDAAQLIITAVADITVDLLDLPDVRQQESLKVRTTRKVHMILLAASHWRTQPEKSPGK